MAFDNRSRIGNVIQFRMAAPSGVESFDSNSCCSGGQMNRRDRRMRRDSLAATVWKLARALLILGVLVAAGACAGGDSGSSGSPSPTAPSGGESSLSGI